MKANGIAISRMSNEENIESLLISRETEHAEGESESA